MAPAEPTTVVLDVDGTLVDTNYQHAIAWHRALRAHGYVVQVWEIHRHIGMGGGLLVAALIGDEGERSDGEAIREAYGEPIGEVQAMHGATELVQGCPRGRRPDPGGADRRLLGGRAARGRRGEVCESIGELRKHLTTLAKVAAPVSP